MLNQNKMTESFKSRRKYIRESKNSKSFAEFISDVFNVVVKDEDRIEKAIEPLFEEDDIDNALLNKVKTKVLKIISEWYDFDLLGCDNCLRKAIKDYVLFKSTNDISYNSSLIDNLKELNEAIFNAFEYSKMVMKPKREISMLTNKFRKSFREAKSKFDIKKVEEYLYDSVGWSDLEDIDLSGIDGDPEIYGDLIAFDVHNMGFYDYDKIQEIYNNLDGGREDYGDEELNYDILGEMNRADIENFYEVYEENLSVFSKLLVAGRMGAHWGVDFGEVGEKELFEVEWDEDKLKEDCQRIYDEDIEVEDRDSSYMEIEEDIASYLDYSYYIKSIRLKKDAIEDLENLWHSIEADNEFIQSDEYSEDVVDRYIQEIS